MSQKIWENNIRDDIAKFKSERSNYEGAAIFLANDVCHCNEENPTDNSYKQKLIDNYNTARIEYFGYLEESKQKWESQDSLDHIAQTLLHSYVETAITLATYVSE